MAMKEKNGKLFFIIMRATIVCVLFLAVLGTTTYAWMVSDKRLAAYAPVSAPEALYIGAGHRDIENNTFEDIRYMYFDGLDAEEGNYVDKVFCVFGKGIRNYRLQIAYTTNNPFTYQIYHAQEVAASDLVGDPPANSVMYVTHQTTPETFYYYADGEPLAGTYLNQGAGGLANGTKHSNTYDDYTHVQANAEPIYWQSSASPAETGNSSEDFVNYYILRVNKNGKENNDRETDILCIVAKAVSVH